MSQISYSKIVTMSDGGSAFADETAPLVSQEVVPGVSMLVGALSTASSVIFLRSDEFDAEPHPAPRQQWVIMLRGAIEVTTSDGAMRRFGPGDLVLAADTEGVGHVTRAAGDSPLEALFVPV
jgi:quercetin dioxygenase-like cupin family protein